MAFMEEAVTISAADDGGFIVVVRVKREKKKKDDETDLCCGPRMDEKTLVAKDVGEVKELMDKLLPDMKPGGMEEDEFAKAFKEVKEDEK
ncbi:MAG: hypothetical protein KAR06_02415 [Deltaproteobacteria bacterium]|nr:hypothetical protein [Deltaproteobacteria bacterium]